MSQQDSRSPAEELACLVAAAAARRGSAASPAADEDVVRKLVAELAGDDEAVEKFFPLLGSELKARGASLPPLEELPTTVMPLIVAVGAALDPQADGEIDYEAAAGRLDELLCRLLGESPRNRRLQQFVEQIRREAAASVAESLRRHGLTPGGDSSARADDFWDLVELAADDSSAVQRRLADLPAARLAELYWEHAAAKLEYLRARSAANAGPTLSDEAAARVAGFVVAQGYDFHALAVAGGFEGNTASSCFDLGAEAARIYGERFGRDIRLGLPAS